MGANVLVKQSNAGSDLRVLPWPAAAELLVQTDTCSPRTACPPPGGRAYVEAYDGPLPLPPTACEGCVPLNRGGRCEGRECAPIWL